MSGLHIGDKQHVWQDGVCQRCFMRSHWAGAKTGCTGIVTKEEHQARSRRVKAASIAALHAHRGHAQPKCEERLFAEAHGVDWPLYRNRRARGYSREEALSKPIDRGVRRSNRDHGVGPQKSASHKSMNRTSMFDGAGDGERLGHSTTPEHVSAQRKGATS